MNIAVSARRHGAYPCSVSKALLAVLLAWMACISVADAQDGLPESKIKAAFLFKFTGYVDWPATAFEQANSPLVIGVLEDDEIASELTRLTAGRSVGTHAVQVRRLSGTDATCSCHVLFIGGSASGRLGRILAGTRSQPVLTVTELEDALGFASVINFLLIDDQVRFDVSLPAAERAGLKISSRLLSVAHQIATVAP